MIFKDKTLVKSPIISVCVPTYNQEKYISETLDSIISQVIEIPFEIIIADDCSLDNTLNICLEYQNRYPEKIVLVSNEQNKGFIKNLFDVLFSRVRGDYIALCAGDDVWISNNKLERQFRILYENQNISLVHTAYMKFFEKSNKKIQVQKWESPLVKMYGQNAIKYVLKETFSSFPLGSSIMFRNKTLIKYSKLYPEIISYKDAPGEGMILLSFCSLDGTFYFLQDEIYTLYRIREESLSHTMNKKNELSFKLNYIFQKYFVALVITNNSKLLWSIQIQLFSVFKYAIINNLIHFFKTIFYSHQNELKLIHKYLFSVIVVFFSLNKPLQKLYIIIFNLIDKIRKSNTLKIVR